MHTLLIIDDDPIVTEMYRRKFNGIYTMVFAGEGESGLKQAVLIQPELIVLDLVLEGGQSGLHVLADLKNNPKTAHIPIIVISNLQHQKESVLQQGASDYLIKTNTNIDEIAQKIKQYISSSYA